jgi:hypothetical protein
MKNEQGFRIRDWGKKADVAEWRISEHSDELSFYADGID